MGLEMKVKSNNFKKNLLEINKIRNILGMPLIVMKRRICLKCGIEFDSYGERLCNKCNNINKNNHYGSLIEH